MSKPAQMMAHAADLARWAAEARAEYHRCVERDDAVQAGIWLAKAHTLEERAGWWRENAATFTPGHVRAGE